MKDLGFLLGLSILILAIWFVEYKEREYCEKKGMVYIDKLLFNECVGKK